MYENAEMEFNAQVRSAYVRMMHGKEKYKKHEMCMFSLTEMSGHAMLMGVLTRKSPYWNFRSLGTPASRRSILELLRVCFFQFLPEIIKTHVCIESEEFGMFVRLSIC